MEKVFADDYSGGIAGALTGLFRRHSTGSHFWNTKIKEQRHEKPDFKVDLRDSGRIRIALGVIVALSRGSLLAGFGSMITVVCVVMLVCRKEILREYHQGNKRPGKTPNT